MNRSLLLCAMLLPLACGSSSESSTPNGTGSGTSNGTSGQSGESGGPSSCCDWLPECVPSPEENGCSEPCCSGGVAYICQACDEGCEPEFIATDCSDCDMLWAAHLVRLKLIPVCAEGDPCEVDAELYDRCGCPLVVNAANTDVIASMASVISSLEAAQCEPTACGQPCVAADAPVSCVVPPSGRGFCSADSP